MELAPIEAHLAVDLVGDDWNLVALGDGDEADEVLPRVDRPARVGRVVDHDRARALVDQTLQMRRVRLPVALGQQ
eukprot:6689901-Prymnesium_polylepis.1